MNNTRYSLDTARTADWTTIVYIVRDNVTGTLASFPDKAAALAAFPTLATR